MLGPTVATGQRLGGYRAVLTEQITQGLVVCVDCIRPATQELVELPNAVDDGKSQRWVHPEWLALSR